MRNILLTLSIMVGATAAAAAAPVPVWPGAGPARVQAVQDREEWRRHEWRRHEAFERHRRHEEWRRVHEDRHGW